MTLLGYQVIHSVSGVVAERFNAEQRTNAYRAAEVLGPAYVVEPVYLGM